MTRPPFLLSSVGERLLHHLAADFAARIGRGVDVDIVLAGRRGRRPARRSAWRCLRPGSRWRSGSQRRRRRSCRLRRARGNARRWRDRRGRNRSASSSASCWRDRSRCRRCPCAALVFGGTSALPSSVAFILSAKAGPAKAIGCTQRKRGKHGLVRHGFLPVGVKRRCQLQNNGLSDLFPKRPLNALKFPGSLWLESAAILAVRVEASNDGSVNAATNSPCCRSGRRRRRSAFSGG